MQRPDKTGDGGDRSHGGCRRVGASAQVTELRIGYQPSPNPGCFDRDVRDPGAPRTASRIVKGTEFLRRLCSRR